MLSMVMIFLLAVAFLFIGYQAFVNNKLYWFAPTIQGYNNRNEKTGNEGLSRIVGVFMILIGLFFLFLSLKGSFQFIL
jgi:hypothetical protein